VRREQSVRHPEGKPTIRQVHAIARLLLAEAEDAVLVTAERGLAAAASRSVLLD
jgi:hypothetical protein